MERFYYLQIFYLLQVLMRTHCCAMPESLQKVTVPSMKQPAGEINKLVLTGLCWGLLLQRKPWEGITIAFVSFR